MQNSLFSSFFHTAAPVFQGSAPGRMDVMGGIADYSGSMVLQMPIKQETTVTLALRKDNYFYIKSILSNDQVLEYTINYQTLLKNATDIDYSFASKQLRQTKDSEWASYIIGCFLVCHKEKAITVTGADILVQSDVPLGKGVSSSASLEIATMKAIGQAYCLYFEKTELPRLAQKAENLIVGAPCGLMDQLASYLGENGKLLPILCQPDIVYQPISIPENIYFVGIDSGIRHSVGGASYSEVRTAAFMGYTLIALQNGTTNELLARATKILDFSHLPYHRYLANIPPSVFEEKYALRLPYKMSGKYFKEYYPVHIDPVTSVDAEKMYSILDCTRHPVYENFRVKTFALLLQYLITLNNFQQRQACLRQLGELMYQSHASYTVCGLGNPYTDAIVEAVKQNSQQGVYGAKITGGGSGGTVCILCEGKEGLQTARNIHQAYQEKFKKEVVFFEE